VYYIALSTIYINSSLILTLFEILVICSKLKFAVKLRNNIEGRDFYVEKAVLDSFLRLWVHNLVFRSMRN
jgi:hypothetical protein